MAALARYRLAGALADSIYWTSFDGVNSTIQSGPLSGAGTITTLYDSGDGADLPAGLAIDPAAGRIYWCNRGDHKIKRAPLAPELRVRLALLLHREGEKERAIATVRHALHLNPEFDCAWQVLANWSDAGGIVAADETLNFARRFA